VRRLSAGVTVLMLQGLVFRGLVFRGLVFGLMVMSLAALAAAQGGGGDAAAAKKYFGTWSGTWEGGGGSGGFDITLEAGKDGAPGGHVSVTGEPTYKATLKTLAFDGAKMTATYDFPQDPSILVTLGATFEGDAAKGTWAIKGPGADPLSGTWTVKKK
jgi:hypothetical protein